MTDIADPDAPVATGPDAGAPPREIAPARSVDRARARRRVSYSLMLLVAVAALVIGVTGSRGPATNAERVHALAETIRCPACRSPAADSEASAAQAIRQDIAERVEAGQTDEEIRAYFASRYGDEILLTPPASGVGAVVWVLPVVAVAVAGAGLAFAFRRWQRWE